MEANGKEQYLRPMKFFTSHDKVQLDEGSDGVIPPLDSAAPVGRAAGANDRCASGVCGTIAGLTFGAGHGRVTD